METDLILEIVNFLIKYGTLYNIFIFFPFFFFFVFVFDGISSLKHSDL